MPTTITAPPPDVSNTVDTFLNYSFIKQFSNGTPNPDMLVKYIFTVYQSAKENNEEFHIYIDQELGKEIIQYLEQLGLQIKPAENIKTPYISIEKRKNSIIITGVNSKNQKTIGYTINSNDFIKAIEKYIKEKRKKIRKLLPH
jgi:predicted transcriptional regulator